ncbi:Transcription factor Spt20 [Trinorchestia longiramus]|nr:Transcription factor Spt20 [Trinorchestia longiramus]
MESLEASINKADAVLSESHATLVAHGSAALAGHAALPRKLAAIYAEEASKPNKIKQNIVHTSELVGKLVERENLSCLIVNLYNDNEGYNIALKLPGGLETETMRLSYEDDEFLTYINQEKLPPMLLDLLDDAGVSDMFHCGCLVAELRDYRRCGSDPPSLASALNSSSSGPHYDKRHVLLRPSMQVCNSYLLLSEYNGPHTKL